MMLKLENIEAAYNHLQVLKGINLNVKEKEIVALIGPNGSGKSTTLKSIFGLVNVTKGKIILDNKEIQEKKAHEIVKLGLSYIPQGRLIFPTLTVEENLKIGGYLLKKIELKKRLEETYERFSILREKKHQRATFLSGGQQQLLCVARSLLLKPKILLLDEPSLGLSPIAVKEIFEEIKKLNKEGISILIVEQNAHLAIEISNRIYVLQNGKVVFEGGKELTKMKVIKDLYLGH